jgi:hypothetical protein
VNLLSKKKEVMPIKNDFKPSNGQSQVYQIRLKGFLDSQWSDWFDGFSIAREEDGNTMLTGQVVDQAALHGLLKKIRDLGLSLISIIQINNNQKTNFH